MAELKKVPTNGLHHLEEALESTGFVVDDRVEVKDLNKIVGYAPKREPARLELPDDKAALLYEAMQWMVSRAEVHTDTLRAIIGVWI